MRLSPSFISFALAAVLAVSAAMAALPAYAQRDVSRDELVQLETERAQALAQLAALEQAGGAVAADLGNLERDLIAAAMESQRREEQATASELKLMSLRSRLGAARGELSVGEEALEDLIASLALSGRHRPPALLTQPADANQAIRAAILMGEVAPQVQAQTKVLSGEIAGLRKLERQVLREAKRLAASEAALALKQAEITQMTAAKRSAYEDVTGDAEALRMRAEMLGKQAETIRTLILSLIHI